MSGKYVKRRVAAALISERNFHSSDTSRKMRMNRYLKRWKERG